MLGNRFSSFAYLPFAGASGGILIACRGPEIACLTLHVGQFLVMVTVTMGASSEPWCLPAVYGPQPYTDKIEFLDELRSVQSSVTCPWMIARDFNLILDTADKNNDNINRRNLGRFQGFMDELRLKDVYLHGRRYSWSNERANPAMEKLGF